jgi:hypothetical protein
VRDLNSGLPLRGKRCSNRLAIFQIMLESTTIIAEGLQHLSNEWMRFAQEGVEQSLNRHDQLQGCRSIQEWRRRHKLCENI